MAVMLRLRSLPGEAGGAEGYWARIVTGPEEQVLRECLRQIEEFATDPPVEQEDEETGAISVVSETAPTAAVLLHAVRGEGGWTAYARIQAHAAWTRDGAERLLSLLPPELTELRDAIQQLLDGRLSSRPPGLSREDAERFFEKFRSDVDQPSDG